MHIVVINRNQQEFVEPMRAYLRPYEPLLVFDRCEPVDGCNYRTNTEGSGFLAGRMRDLGAEGIDDDILFLDGDKIPQGDIVADINRLKNKYDCICYGVGKNFENSEFRKFMLTDDIDDIVPFQKMNFPYAYGCYSCGMWLSKNSIRNVRELNGGRIFHPAFDGYWGDEDNFLADELNAIGLRIGFSTHVRLSGSFGNWMEKAYSLARNFAKRIELTGSLTKTKRGN